MTNRALVLGGGGVTGVAWELGLLAGLAEAGADVSGADLVVGTSAGSVVGAQVAAGLDLAERYGRQLLGSGNELPARVGIGLLATWLWANIRHRDRQAARARIGRQALQARTVPEAERREVIASRLGVADWPERELRITAVDAESGEFVVFDRNSGVGLVDAVGASCAVPGVWPPVTINGRRYIDGGMRTPTNADVAAGAGQIVVIAPISRGFGPSSSPVRQVARLAGTRAVVITPDRAARQAIGRNVLDPSRRAYAATAGHDQAATVADAVAAVWSD